MLISFLKRAALRLVVTDERAKRKLSYLTDAQRRLAEKHILLLSLHFHWEGHRMCRDSFDIILLLKVPTPHNPYRTQTCQVGVSEKAWL